MIKKIYVHALLSGLFFALLLTGCGKESAEGTAFDPDLPYLRPVTASSGKWIAKILSYDPAPGQFINTSQGNEAAPQSIVGKKGLVSLGGFGGSIVFMFDHTVLNKPGYDFVIHGNAAAGSSEPGIVMVSCDKNGNGLPDDEWFELAGEDHTLASTVKGYEITYTRPGQTVSAADVAWTDNTGRSGTLDAAELANFHTQCFWPLFGAAATSETLTLTGTLLAPDVTSEQVMGQTNWNLKAAGRGYADNLSNEYRDATGNDDDTQNSNKFDIDNAVDAAGNKVSLKGIDFIKVYTAVNGQHGWIGESSTEVVGAISLSVAK